MDIAKNTAEHVLSFNDERKEKQKNMEEEALSLAKKTKCKNGILVHSEEFHIGVVGIVAAKIVEKFNLPTVVVGKSNDKWKGSCRSIGNIDIKKILDRCPELFEAYGGHSMAAGVTMKPDMLGVAAQIFDKACSDYYNENGIIKDKTRYYDVEINIDQINPEVSRLLLDTIYPYCNENNNEPIFVLKDIEIVGTTVKEGATWRLFSFYAQNGDKKLEYPFKFFTTKYGSEIEGRKAKIMFTFPQKRYFTNTLYDKFELTVKDIVINT
jgi:single-stranded-DNA-specific exonuclease